MSMIGEYARLTPAELEHALDDPEWATEHVEDMMGDGSGPSDERPRRCLDIDKAWDILDFLLRRIDFPVDIVHGEEEMPDADDWGYGPPRYLTPERVRTAATALLAMPFELLAQSVDGAELAKADLYPTVTADEADKWLAYVGGHYRELVPFFEEAARDGDAMLAWLD
jgi:hypothetical protein